MAAKAWATLGKNATVRLEGTTTVESTVERKEILAAGPLGLAGASIGSYFGSQVGSVTGVPARPWTYQRAIREGMGRVPAVYRAVRIIALQQALRPILIVPLAAGDNTPITDDPLLPLLNPTGASMANLTEGPRFLRNRVSQVWILSPRGGFLEVVKNRGGQPTRLALLPTARTHIEPAPDGSIARYRIDPIRPGDQPRYIEDTSTVIWFREPHPEDPWAGLTPLEAAGLTAEMDYFARLYNRSMLANDGRPGGIVAVADKAANGIADPKELDRVERKFGGGPVDAGRVVVVDGTVTYQDLSMSPRDMQWDQGSQRAQRDIFMVFGVPMSKAADATDQTYANSGQDDLNWWDGDMGYHCDAFASLFAPYVQAGAVPTWDKSTVACLAQRELARRSGMQDEVSNGLRSPLSYAQETGAKIGAEPGDFPDVPGTRALWRAGAGEVPIAANPADQDDVDKLAPLGAAPQAAGLQAGAAGDQGQGQQYDDGSSDPGYGYGYDGQKVLQLHAGRRTRRQQRKAKVGNGDSESDEDRAVDSGSAVLTAALAGVWAAELAADDSTPSTWWSAAAQAAIPALWAAAQAGAAPVPQPAAADPDADPDDVEPEPTVAQPENRAPAGGAATIVGLIAAYAALNGASDDEPSRTSALVRSVAVSVLWVAGSAWDQGADLEDARSADAAATAAGTAPTDLAAFADGMKTWLDRVAPNGVRQAVEAGKHAAVGLLGDVVTRTWHSRHDNRVRHAHQLADGQQTLGDKPFTVGGEELRYPGDPLGSPGNTVNCRCRTRWSRSQAKTVVHRVLLERKDLAGDFDEAKHPRGAHGRFGHGFDNATGSVNADLDEAETKAVADYQWGFVGLRNWAGILNGALRGDKRMTKAQQAKRDELDSAIGKATTTKDVTVHRLVGNSRDDFLGKLTPGASFTDAGYVSTGRDLDLITKRLPSNPQAVFSIDVPAGSHALATGPEFGGHPDYLYQSEVLLPRGSSFTVESIDKESRPWQYHLRLS